MPFPSPDGPGVVWLPDLHLAFPSGQTPGTRLVLTQSTYQLQRWIDWLDSSPGFAVVAHASGSALARSAAEAQARRGPWFRIEIVELEGDDDDDEPPGELEDELGTAFTAGSQDERVDACARAILGDPENPALRLAEASAWMEHRELERAGEALEHALALSPDWEAVWFEYGKLALRQDDLEQAADRFGRAARLMPSFSAALSNLGAALAETERPDQAVEALEQALRYDPRGYTVLNNLGVVYREQGRLDDAVSAARRVVDLAPAFVFGFYNLAHALFLQGRFEESRDVYAAGQARDPQRNPVQACRLAVARAATGDAASAVRELTALAASLPGNVLDQLLDEAEETLEALIDVQAADGESVQDALYAVREIRDEGRSTEKAGLDS
jgi:tetratricopeptide (TPR) repeat protein